MAARNGRGWRGGLRDKENVCLVAACADQAIHQNERWAGIFPSHSSRATVSRSRFRAYSPKVNLRDDGTNRELKDDGATP